MTAAASELALPLPVRERGYAVDPMQGLGWWVQALEEATPELQWPFSIDVFDAMRKQDAQVGSVFRAVAHPILQAKFRVNGDGCAPEVTELVAKDLGLPIVGQGNEPPHVRRRRRIVWKEHLRLALLCLPFGHMVFEQVYDVESEPGRAHLRKLGPRMHRTIDRFNVAADGGLVSVVQRGRGFQGGVTLPISRLVVYVNEREGGNWLGQSLLRTCYKNWLLKDRLLRVGTQTVERNGMGIPSYTAGTDNPAEVAKGQELMSEVRAGDDSGIAGPKESKFELKGVTGQLPDALPFVRYHDEQIARAVLAHFLNLGTQTGSWALGSTLEGVFASSVDAVCQQLVETANAYIVEDLVDLNFGTEEPAPRIVFDEIGENKLAIVQAIAILVNAKVLRPDESLEAFLRTVLELPDYDPATAVPVPAAPAPAPAPAPEEDA